MTNYETPLLSCEQQRLLLTALEQEARARAIRRSLTEWSRHCGFEPALHHRLLIRKLEQVASGEIDRLAVFMPPGSAKSTYSSILFPPWFLSRTPKASVLAASHTTELAEKWGRRVRNLVTEHGSTLQLALASDSQAAGRWALASGGEYYAAGVGVGIAGFRADLAVIDDPVRSREDADSQAVRDRIWDWYKTDLLTRLRPGGRVVLIQTRWHEDDLAGRIIAEAVTSGEHWHVLSLPAEAEPDDPLRRKPGEWLWDDEYGYARFLAREKATQLPRNWSALYQQRPAPETGNYFRDDWFRGYVKPPERSTLNVYGGSDYAVTADGGDYTVHAVVGVDPENRMYLLDLWRGQTSSDRWIEAWCDLVCRWKPLFWAEERGQIISGIGPYLQRRAIERRAYTHRQQFVSRGDKATRAQSFRGRMAMLGLYVPTMAPWYPALRSELLSFPAGKYDDQVDALGLIGQLLDRITAGQRPEKLEEKKLDPYRPFDDVYDLQRDISVNFKLL
jgi:predicted phage terminase large subunit-like protein